MGKGRAGRGRVRQGRAGLGKTGRGRAGQVRSGQVRARKGVEEAQAQLQGLGNFCGPHMPFTLLP